MTKPLTSPGRLVAGRYRLISQIGGGGMGTVWLARDELLGRQIAIKQVLSPSTVSPKEADQQRQRALREGRIAARLSHPHAISVYDVALEQGQPWLVMEYLPSRSLAAVLAEDGILRVSLAAQIGAQVADALAATHAAGIVHRDVKPANILIGQGGRIEGLVKITDFGISHASGDVTLTQTGQITGTPAYLSPEVAQGREMTEASDVFSLGATLYACLEGQPPFGMEDNALGMLHRVAGAQITPPKRAGILTRPLLRMLAADPADRPTMAEVRDELATLAAGRGGDTTTVLLARTELGTSPGRGSTEAFPGEPTAVHDGAMTGAAGGAAGLAAAAAFPAPPKAPTKTWDRPMQTEVPAQGEPAAEPVAAPTPPPPAAPPKPEAGRRRRGGALWALVGVLGLVLAGLLVFWVTRPEDPGRNDASATSAATSAATSSASETAAESSSQAAEETTGSSAAPTTSTAPSTTVAAAGDPLTASNIEDFLASYHAQVLTDPRGAYARTGPTLRSAISEDNYVEYWSQFSDVEVRDIDATDGQATATGTLVWTYADGRVESGRHRFTFLVQDGELRLDSDRGA
ncbi:MAG: serine/threonine protein kinase [Blastococcus sp.]|nr:serine/threonine protein kinase [Blastococcus sp.]